MLNPQPSDSLPTQAGGEPPIRSAIIVGGGLAGISAALALAKHGLRVTLIEGRTRLGGRTGSFTVDLAHNGEPESVDYCQHVGMGCCTNLKQLIEWLGQQDAWHEHRQLHFFGPDGQYRPLKAWPLLPAPLHLAGWLLRWPGLSLRDCTRIARGLAAIDKLTLGADCQSQSALKWLQQRGQTVAAIERFWSTIVVSALGEDLSRVSLAAVAKVLQDGFLRHRQAFHLLVPTRPLGELFGTQAAEQLRSHQVDIHLNSPVQAIEYAIDGANHAPIRVVTSQATFTADSLVLAVPWQQLNKLDFGDDCADLCLVSEQAAQLQGSAITGVHTWWDRAWLDLPHAAIVGRLCQWVFPKEQTLNRAHVAARAGHYYQIVISASRDVRGCKAAEVATRIHEDLCHVFPQVREARLLRHHVVTDPKAVFSITPASYALRPGGFITQRVMLAGDWTATGWPATMEGAVLSGFKAAENLLRLNYPAPPRIVRPPLALRRR